MSGPSRTVLRLEEVERVHGEGAGRVRALGPVSLELEAGELVAVMGPSGSGKSTLLALAGALDRPSAGRVHVLGRALDELDAAGLASLRRRTIGLVFQELNLLAGLSALENVALPLELDGLAPRRARAQAQATLEAVRMGELAGRFPDDLSGGEQQRVAIARAMVGPRELLLADEPTGALDTLNGERVLRLLREACERGRAVLLVTHDAAHAAWADRVLFLRDGRLVNPAASARSVPTRSSRSRA